MFFCSASGRPRCSIVNSVAKNGVAKSKYPFSTCTSSRGLVIIAWAKSGSTLGAPGKNRRCPASLRVEFQLVVIVGIDQRGKRASHGWSFRIALSVFFEQIVGVAGKARVNASGGQARAALQLGAELTEVDAQVRLHQIVFA